MNMFYIKVTTVSFLGIKGGLYIPEVIGGILWEGGGTVDSFIIDSQSDFLRTTLI